MRQRFFNLRVKFMEHDLTQEEAAKIAGISPSAMVNRMSGKYPFKPGKSSGLLRRLTLLRLTTGSISLRG